MATNETREQREARIQASVTGFVRGWFGSAAAYVTPEEMLNHVNSIADNHNLQFVHRLLCQLHNLMLSQNLYMGMADALPSDL
jgi:hypothetical protein